MTPKVRLLAALAAGFFSGAAGGAKQVPPPVSLGPDGRLVHTADDRGDRVPDYSSAGYRGGGVPLPAPGVTLVVAPAAGDNTARLQAALDHAASLPADVEGRRGCVQLTAGRYEVAGQLRLAGGVTLRGAGSGAGGTLLYASGTGRRAVIVLGTPVRTAPPPGPGIRVVGERVPVGTLQITVADPSGFAAGDTVLIRRPSPASWLAEVGMDDSPGRQPFAWKPGTMDIRWERRITSIRGSTLVLDAPLTTALEQKHGGAAVHRAFPADAEPPREIGVSHLGIESQVEPGNPKDEDHAWTAIRVEAVRDAWIADIAVRRFAGSAVHVGAEARRVTVQDCVSSEPVSEDGGYRRLTFHTAGQQTLFLRCRASGGRHDFSAGHLAAGPNVFLRCESEMPGAFSGSLGSWASGILFDNVRIEGGALRLDNLEIWNQGVGWSAAAAMAWQTTASTIICRSPPGATNWAAGVWGQFVGDGPWSMVNEFIRPDSLYEAQLAERLGPNALRALAPVGAPVVSVAAARFEPVVAGREEKPPIREGLALDRGWLTLGGAVATGKQATVAWWRGSVHPARAAEIGPALTRFVPDRIGPGLTDDLEEVASGMMARGEVALRHNWGLWYDRRRDDHQMVRRPDGDVWPPFFEQPWARSGRGTASNGLSRYDLEKFNPWYFGRLADFARIARLRGLVLVNEMYFQHNLLEAGAHWAEFPWRELNTISTPGFPEPPPYAGGKRIFMAELFYDVAHPRRRELHRAYIRHCLANLAGETNVIHTLGEEFSGPLSFHEFWLDVVAEWKTETGRRPLIALSAPKDVQDAILADPRRGSLIDVIDLKYWWRTAKGLHAPAGGENLAPRQHERLWKGGRPSGVDLAGMVHEYRSRFPEKAVITPLAQGDPWLLAASGASFPALPASTDPALLRALAKMRPVSSGRGGVLASDDGDRFGYFPEGDAPPLSLPPGDWLLRRIDPRTGSISEEVTLQGGTGMKLPGKSPYWLVKGGKH